MFLCMVMDSDGSQVTSLGMRYDGVVVVVVVVNEEWTYFVSSIVSDSIVLSLSD